MASFSLFGPRGSVPLILKAGALCAALAVAAPASAVTWTEVGDAGQSQTTAQSTLGATGPLTDIFGTLRSSSDADLYIVNITNPATFRASTVNAAGAFLDTQLFLLTLSGAPVMVNDDDAGGLSVLSTLPAGSAFRPLVAGSYLLGVALSGYDPVNASNQLLFAAGDPTSVRGPASGLQPAVLGGFFDSADATQFGAYDIQLSGVGAVVAAVPEPSSALLLALGGGALAIGAARRRARRDAPAAAGVAA